MKPTTVTAAETPGPRGVDVRRVGPGAAVRAGNGPCGCVAGRPSPIDEISTLQALVGDETEPVVVLTRLLRLCRDDHAVLWEHHADPRCRARVAEKTALIASCLAEPGSASLLGAPARDALAAALVSAPEGPPVVVLAHALAELIDDHYGHSFASWFRRRSPYQPAVGDPMPLDRPDLRRVTALAPTAPPWRLANRLDETRRIRLAGAWATQFRIVFDYEFGDLLGDLFAADGVVAACQPNVDLGDFGLAGSGPHLAFPIGPVDAERQLQLIEAQVGLARDLGAAVVVLPELVVTEALARRLEHWVRDTGPIRLLVTGSFHGQDGGEPERRANRALAWVRGASPPVVQDKHSPADEPVVEDITPSGWPEVRVHVTPDGWHLVLAICRDLLNPNAVHAMTEAGVNLVLAPAMSETLVAFGGPVAQLVGSNQALVVVANNPGEWPSRHHPGGIEHPARALFGHPGFARQTRSVETRDRRSGVASLAIASGDVGWHPIGPSSPGGPDKSPSSEDVPDWALRLRAAPLAADPAPGGALRPAAVLVLLTVLNGVPAVMLTRRSGELSNYPEQYVFSGGSLEAFDEGPSDAALREAGEETGLEPASLRILGALPAFALEESGFKVTPILAFAERPRFGHPPNAAEVAEVLFLPLDLPLDASILARTGAMTAAVIDIILARLGPDLIR